MFNADEVYPVSDFISLCSKTINNNIPIVWISGEISNLSTPSSGHIYFSLKDNKSQVRCAFFRLSQRNLKFKLESGQQVIVRAAPSLYEVRGDFQLIIQKLEPIGVGSLELGFEQLKKKLETMGLFKDSYKKPLPIAPKNIGIITSKSGAVIQDIIKVLSQRYPFANLIIYDTPTQGEGASLKIINALKSADSSICDVLIIARGGGSREDLWCFNDEDLALAVFDAKTPIVSSIGHEVDSTIIDFVADVYASTPSVAAMFATPDKLEILNNQNSLYLRLIKTIKNTIFIYKNNIINLDDRLNKPQFNNYFQQVDGLNIRLLNIIKANIKIQKISLDNINTKLLIQNPLLKIQHKKQELSSNKTMLIDIFLKKINQKQQKHDIFLDKLKQLININFSKNKFELKKNINSLDNFSPLKVFDRGYSITTLNNKSLLSVQKLKNGDKLSTQLGDGKIESIVTKVKIT